MRQIAPIIALAVLLTGCATFNNSAGKLLASTAATVDTSMKAWASYVVVAKIDADGQREVRNAYVKYQAAMATAETAYVALVKDGNRPTWETARTVLAATTASLTDLINLFMHPPLTETSKAKGTK